MNFNHSEIYELAKEKFREKGYDVEFGSNTQQIQNGMQYLISMLNQNTQVNIRETMLSSQTKRQMILEDARLLGYEASQKISFQYDLTLNITNKTNTQQTFSLSNFQVFKSGQNNYLFLDELNTNKSITLQGNETKQFKIVVKEGKLITPQNDQNLTYEVSLARGAENEILNQEFIDIPYKNVENSGVYVSVSYKDSNDEIVTETWTKTNSYLLESNLKQKNEFIRQDDIDSGIPRIYFKYQNVGKPLKQGSVINSSVIISKGTEGIAERNFEIDATEYPTNIFDVSVVKHEVRINGQNEESDESIKLNAPIFNNTQNRIVTKHDFEQIQGSMPSVRHAQVWDSKRLFESQPGYIWFSFVPFNMKREFVESNRKWVLQETQNLFLSDSETEEVLAHIQQYSIPTLELVSQNPIYLNFDVKIIMQQYNANQSTDEVNWQIFEQVNSFFRYDGTDDTKAIETFNQKFFNSDLIDYIMQNIQSDNMFDLSVYCNALITKDNITLNKNNQKEVVIRVGQEFQPIFNNGVLQHDQLPVINTQNFLGADTLMNTSIFSSSQNSQVNQLEAKITLAGEQQGVYRVYQDTLTIEIILKHESIISHLESDKTLRMSLAYPTPNIQLRNNTFARLNTVEII